MKTSDSMEEGYPLGALRERRDAAQATRARLRRRTSGSPDPSARRRAGAVAQQVAAPGRPRQPVRSGAWDAEHVDPVVERREHDLEAPVAVEVADRRCRRHADPVFVTALVAQADVVEPLAGGGEHDEPARARVRAVGAEDELGDAVAVEVRGDYLRRERLRRSVGVVETP